jgi:hypothetical protein
VAAPQSVAFQIYQPSYLALPGCTLNDPTAERMLTRAGLHSRAFVSRCVEGMIFVMNNSNARFGFLAVVASAAVLLTLYCWCRIDVGRFSYHESNDMLTVMDSRTGRFYFLSNNVWHEVDPRTGQDWDRAYVKVN